MMQSTLLPSQKAILAMSLAQYLRFTPSPSKEEEYLGKGPDKLSVGICIFRLDGRTSQPAILLLRRSLRRWQRTLSTTSERQRAGDWELPGGEVKEGDFCISAAIERLVREQTGLRVTKVLEMLEDVRWMTETKVLLCDEENEETDEYEDEEDGYGEEYGYGNGVEDGANGDQRLVKMVMVGKEIGTDWRKTLPVKRGWSGGDDNSSSNGTFANFHEHGIDILGVRVPRNSSSPSLSPCSSPAPSTPDSSSILPLLPPPKFYNYGHNRHRSLEPAPLSLPRRSMSRSKPITPRTPVADSLQRTPTSVLPLLQPVVIPTPQVVQLPAWDRRHAQIISYKIVRKKYVQLNFTVLVDEEPEEKPVPPFLARSSTSTDGKEPVYDHDALVWATFSRVRRLPMSEDLRHVVYQGLAWMGKLAGGFF
ncbi:hypothetical protein HD806DRAFT_524803 [Xylariaceae sp. AK1471]|nr:hypothetical protein HD806DRAFT_524803 [Xylariaceae sp. AK1471]